MTGVRDARWKVLSELDVERSLFDTLDTTINQQGCEINSSLMSKLLLVDQPVGRYYVKIYAARGRGLRRYLGRSRIRAEWENLQKFLDLKIPTARIVAYGELGKGSQYRGALVLAEVTGTKDLESVARDAPAIFTRSIWRRLVIRRLADAVRSMHLAGFVHTDLKWRNILVEMTDDPKVFLIDCPQGRLMFGPFLRRGMIKDLACLDKVAKRVLSKTQRLRFYLAYTGKTRLAIDDRDRIEKVLDFFSGRD